MIGDVAVMATGTIFVYDPSLRPPVIPADKMFVMILRVEHRFPRRPQKKDSVAGGWLEGHIFWEGVNKTYKNTLGATLLQVAPYPFK